MDPQPVQVLEDDRREVVDAIARLEREISLLREYRTRLVADVVTGKLDVRVAAGQLPEEAGEPAGDLSEEADPSDSSDSSDEVPKE